MPNRFRKIQAKLVLAFIFLVHLIKRLFSFRRTSGLEKFLTLFKQDCIYPVTSEERALFPSFQRCLACSLCTLSCSAILEGRAPSTFEPKFIMLGYGRSSHESEYFLDEWLPCIECARCTIQCPNGVPIHEMAEQILSRRSRIEFRKGA